MIRNILAALICSIAGFNANAQFGLYASAAYIGIDGSNSFYNNTAPGLGQDIGTVAFQGTDFGAFEQNSGKLKLIGSEIKTYKGISDNVCSGTLFFTVYPTGSRPASPVFTPIDLGFYSDCFSPTCGSFFGSFNLAAGGGCCSDRDQKWQSPGFGLPANVDLTTNTPGVYTLEIYYAYTGEDGGNGCTATKYDNNGNNPVNYTAGFTITTPVPVSFGDVRITNNQSYNSIYWSTYSEAMTSVFKLERSGDGTQYYPIAEIPAAGFSSTVKNYSLKDLNPLRGMNYYRVKMMEADGKYQHSAVVKTNNKEQTACYLLNNPVKEIARLMGTAKGDQVSLFNAYGSLISRNISVGNYFNLNVSTLPNGTYFIRIIAADKTQVLPMIVSN